MEEICIIREKKRFEEHLNIPLNNKIIFSGIFGIGKTYFIQSFFEKNEKYNSFIISPVNYSISKNQDILNYIKYDLIFSLLNKNVNFDKVEFDIKETLPYYLQENTLDIIKILAKNSGKIGKPLNTILEIYETIKKDNHSKQIDEKNELIDFLKNQKNQEGNIFEENLITEIVTNKINNLKTENSNKSVLIIDDLDRLDPEHIFRILNVFANHIGLDDFKKNKFGFDKIILVCDIDNLKNIFSSKYGQNVDFSGYIDKFFSHEIYVFNNKSNVRKHLSSIIKAIVVSNGMNDKTTKISEKVGELTLIILEEFVNYNIINLRSLLKFVDIPYLPENYNFKRKKERYSSNNLYIMIQVFDLLKTFFGSVTNLKSVIDKLAIINTKKDVNHYNRHIFGDILILIEYQRHNQNEIEYSYIDTKEDLVIEYKIDLINYTKNGSVLSCSYLNTPKERNSIPFSKLLKRALEAYIHINNNKE